MAIKQFIILARRSQSRLSSHHHQGAFFYTSAASHSTPLKPVADVCWTSPLEQIVAQRGGIKQLASYASRKSEDSFGRYGIPSLNSWRHKTHSVVPLAARFLYYPINKYRTVQVNHCFSRSFASASKPPRQDAAKAGETKKDISTVDDPFDSPTYHIPEKPVTFTEGASYSLVILVGLGIAAAAAYAVFKELIFQPKEYKIYGKALARVQDDSQVRVRIGSPIKGYGQESRNRAARQRISHRIWNDEDGVEHVEVYFYIRGPHGGGRVSAEMFKDKETRDWKFTYVIVEITSPSQSRLILESYIPM